ncbi:hypothetical protein PVIIG_05890 [Plasmodium vivax India VII]|uniref:VIR protein n=1 Tax=Plasmodium vivax India VII TaxID=1077284 RepID=A0A0J9UTM7_PLAVI|nr:hypothetical protein PVIIG_05890 [Plasmodium vivax India VII]
MESSQSDPGYISYHDYPEVKRQFDRMIDIRNDKTRFEEIINTISGVPKTPKFRDNVLTILHKVLSNDPAFMGNIGDNYCRYINFWLNKEIQDADDHLKKSYFDIFVKFSDKFFLKRTNIKNNPCKNYIFNLDNETTNIMRILYGLYDEYKKIKSYSLGNYSTSCDYLLYLASNHNSAIDKYYEKDQNLYKKFEQIKKLIDKLTKHSSSPCTQDIYLNSPKEVIRLEEEAKKRAAEQEEQERQETLRKQREEALRTQRQQQLKSKEELLQRPENNNIEQEQVHLGAQQDFQVILLKFSDLLNQHLFLVYLEEEDDSVKFLVVLEDFQQEISQIFRNIVVGMLDIVQWI